MTSDRFIFHITVRTLQGFPRLDIRKRKMASSNNSHFLIQYLLTSAPLGRQSAKDPKSPKKLSIVIINHMNFVIFLVS